ncbi:MAG: SAM-dependent methyltransferase [Opitutaceae bacterium]
MLSICQPGYEELLARELTAAGSAASAHGPGWVLSCAAPEAGRKPPETAFARIILLDPKEITGSSVNGLAQTVLDGFSAALGGERIEGEWPEIWLEAAEPPGLGRRAASVRNAFDTLLKRKLSRIAGLSRPALPVRIGEARGLFVHFTDFGRAWLSRTAFVNGPRRMADDPAAPSRSYLKVEEAYGLVGREPAPGETVADLGAAPGGWSYSAARRGARVIAVDNGPLKGGALDHPNIEHRREDAFRFSPAPGERFDWLLCDLVDEPHHVLDRLVRPWIERRWCRWFVVNLKFGRVDPVEFLRELRSPLSPFSQAASVRLRHLFHNREEFTAAGWLKE